MQTTIKYVDERGNEVECDFRRLTVTEYGSFRRVIPELPDLYLGPETAPVGFPWLREPNRAVATDHACEPLVAWAATRDPALVGRKIAAAWLQVRRDQSW